MAVYTDVALEDLEHFIAAYDLGAVLAFKGIAEGVENSNYLLNTEKGRYILTLYEKRVKDSDLPYFIDLMEHLATRGIPCPTPIRDKNGDALNPLCGKRAAIISFLDGVSLRRPQPIHCDELGTALADMHLAGRDFEGVRNNDLSIGGWRRILDSCGDQLESIETGLSKLVFEEIGFLEKNWPRDLPQGIIHADLFPDNVFFLGDRLSGLIDFYFACNDFYVYDLCVCLNSWCFEADGSFNITKAGRLVNAYAQKRPLDTDEIDALPVLARGAALRFLATRAYDWLNHDINALVRPKDPLEFSRILRFHQHAENAGTYGLAI